MTSFMFVFGLLSQYFFPEVEQIKLKSQLNFKTITPHQSRLEFSEFIRMKLISRQDQPYNVLRQQRE